MKTFRGHRTPSRGAWATVDGLALPLHLELRNHSPTGFEWGYLGSGPHQLALAILAEVVGADVARQHYSDYCHEVIACLNPGPWRIGEQEVWEWLERRGVKAPASSGNGSQERR